LGEVLYGRVFNIQRFSLQDGPGLRTTVFLKGCPLSCAWCHNPEGQALECEVITVETRCIHCGTCKSVCPSPELCMRCGTCARACPTGARQLIGRDVTSNDLVTEVLRDRPFFDESGGGVTFSGGEPLLQAPFLMECLARLKADGIHLVLDTCGFAHRDSLLKAALLADLVLFDLKLIDSDRHAAATGKRNERIVENLAALGQARVPIWIRVPVIPGINDDDANLDATAELAAGTPGVCRVDLLPYHTTGVSKFARLGTPFRLDQIVPPTAERMDQLADGFRRHGIPVTIGGHA